VIYITGLFSHPIHGHTAFSNIIINFINFYQETKKGQIMSNVSFEEQIGKRLDRCVSDTLVKGCK